MASLHSLFLKPSLRCTAACGHCDARRSFYRTRSGAPLSLERYLALIDEARLLGARSLHLSGGEPTLYSGLVELVRAAKRLGMFTVLNTNGTRITEDYAVELLEAGLHSVIISLHGHDAERHDRIKKRPGSFDEAVNAVAALRRLRDTRYPGFILSTQTIVMRSNFRDLAGIIDLVCNLDVDAHGISYLEGDFDLSNTPSAEDIDHMRETVIPAVIGRLRTYPYRSSLLRYAAVRLVSRLYGGPDRRRERMSRGIFRKGSGAPSCRSPRGFAMVLADGSVCPCNMVEYTEGPVLGNVHETGLGEILRSPRWREFAKHGYEYCRYCPTHLHIHIPIAASLRKLLPLVTRNPAYEQKSIFTRVREAV